DDPELVGLDAELVEPERLDVRRASRGEQDPRHAQLARALTLARHESGRDLVAVARDALHERAEYDFEPLVLERDLELLGGLPVRAWRDLVECVDDGHAGAEARERLAELEPDRTAADDEQRLGQLG